ncbi:hypothetical protein GCM10011369_27390 [Neiella marina]|uniref:Thioredoxin domain-containing protein n=1 Tax=Neiella marina TaxID=508461 RepID=A0A8J2U7F9_9GAMM|nr:TlpA disulfide reductase family protein [Neiella marina]GGA83897.1 hypothetical protein GCM10011369_27390 [Neiella marina]
MKKLVLLLSLLFVGCVWGQSYEEKVAMSKALIGKPVQSHAFYTLDKQPITFASVKGKPIVAYFFASWCAPCYEGLENLHKATELTQSEVEVIAVSLDEDWDKLQRMLIKTGFSGQVWKSADAESALRRRLFANFSGSLPHIIRIDSQGILVEGGSRVKTTAQWAAVISQKATLREASELY